MKRLIIPILGLMLVISSCQKDDSMDSGGPITRYLGGKWRLDRIVTPTQIKVGSQIGYAEIIESGNDQVNDFEHVFRDNKLVANYIWSRNPWPVASASNMTATVTYTNGFERFFKIKRDSKAATLETSGYVPKVGTTQDSLVYFYTSIQ